MKSERSFSFAMASQPFHCNSTIFWSLLVWFCRYIAANEGPRIASGAGIGNIHSPGKIMIINNIRSLLLLLSLSLLLKMNGEDTRGIVGKSVWNSTCRNLEEKVASIIFVIFKTAHIYKWVDAMQCNMYQKEGHWVSKQVTVWFISFTAQLSLLWLPECPIKDRHWCKRPNF